MRKRISLISAVLICSVSICSCGSKAEVPSDTSFQAGIQQNNDTNDHTEAVTDTYDDDYEDYEFVSTLTDEGQIIYYNPEGKVSFCSGDFYGDKVYNFDDAINALYQNISMLSDNEDIELEADFETTIGDVTFYSIRQVYEGEDVYDCIAKVAVDADGNVLGLINSLLNGHDEKDFVTDPFMYPEEDYFAGKTSSSWTGTVVDEDGKSREVTVPVVKDPKDGKTYLADAERGIICVDYDFIDDRDTIDDLHVLPAGEGAYSDYVLIYYDLYIKVHDFYKQRGWNSPNGRGTPTLLAIDIGTAGEEPPPSMGAYVGNIMGYEIVDLSARLPNEADLSLVGHEFTHIVSGANHVGEYFNESGAINESLSDIMGNIIQVHITKPSKIDWFEECFGNGEPYDYSYRVWDEYYHPNVYWDNPEFNDHGEVHHNSGIVSSISYHLYNSGMSLEDQADFWIMADMALSPDTDFSLLAAKLPWCMEIAGYEQYEGALLSAIDKCGMKDTSVPEKAPEGRGIVRLSYPDIEYCRENEIYFHIVSDETGEEFITWPQNDTGEVAAVLFPGTYMIYAQLGEDGDTYIYSNDNWIYVDEKDENYSYLENLDEKLDVKAGDYFILKTKGLPVR